MLQIEYVRLKRNGLKRWLIWISLELGITGEPSVNSSTKPGLCSALLTSEESHYKN